MPAKIRLQRRGRKARPFYRIVIADIRAPRDGRFIESIGTYDPVTHPATIDLDFEKALDWIQKGAQPTDTVRNILSLKGVMYKNHLQKGVRKEALTQAEADARFNEWMRDKEEKLEQKRKNILLSEKELAKKQRDAEAKIREARAAELAKKQQAAAAKAGEESAKAEGEEATSSEAETAQEEATQEQPAEEAKAEAQPEAKQEEKPGAKEEEKPEAKQEEARGEVKEEKQSEAKQEEAREEEPEAKEEEKKPEDEDEKKDQ